MLFVNDVSGAASHLHPNYMYYQVSCSYQYMFNPHHLQVLPEGKAIFWGHTTLVALPLVLPGIGILIAYLSIATSIWKIKQRRRVLTQVRQNCRN